MLAAPPGDAVRGFLLDDLAFLSHPRACLLHPPGLMSITQKPLKDQVIVIDLLHGIRADDVGGPAGAPQSPMLARKLVLTTLVAAVVWLGVYIVVHEPWFSFRGS